MDHLIIEKNNDKRTARRAISLIILVMLGVVGVWVYQTAALFSEDALNNYEKEAAETNEQINAGLELSNQLEDQLPLFDGDPSEALEILEARMEEAQKQEDKILDSIAQEVIDELETENAVTDSDNAQTADILPTAEELPEESENTQTTIE